MANKGKKSSPTSSGKLKYYYCGEDGHYKNDCNKFKDEADQLFCSHYCDANGHDEHSYGKLHPDLVSVLKKGQRKYNNFGRAEHANSATLRKDDEGAFIDLNLMCIVSDQGGEFIDSWCEVCSEESKDFDDDVDVSNTFVFYEVDINNFNFNDES